ncbi:sulfite exporter TauE/SafE family protein [Defluviimonas salinarum]|uniref:Probable membrane transporter protein n=1 Tax=Defluviimonas salinarum TaxID=2992147 RepID=A0ABT3IYP0_9RHOB|nr:sulfite exporter TauE/SafE family protein [Defluviimonas salinarum]MCW3780542.1 sulfite exporter TauE/SafE family protein [Defluviimonas salinarum]
MIGYDLTVLAMALAVTLFAAVVKGAVGFAMPMIMISGLASFLPADTALAALILPTLATNLAQALRQGPGAAIATTVEYRRLLVALCLVILVAAQLVPVMPQAILLATLGLPITAFALSQLAGWQLRFDAHNRGRAEILTGLVGGFFGGISGVWGPPTIALLISLDVDKRESVRVQGVVYLIGSAMLLAAHLGSGVADAETLSLSALLTPPALAGLWLGFAIQDRLDARRFRRWTLVVLAATGLNLVRRALTL